MFFTLVNENNFLIFYFSKLFAMKVVEENWHQLLQKFESLWRKQISVYINEDFAMN